MFTRSCFDLIRHLHRARSFSFKTFGPPNKPRAEGLHAASGVIDHLGKELREASAAPHDLEEWADIAILAFDGALRMGYTPEQIAGALSIKQRKNELRRWPDWRTAVPGRAIEHVRE